VVGRRAGEEGRGLRGCGRRRRSGHRRGGLRERRRREGGRRWVWEGAQRLMYGARALPWR
jgi:hypothetical protein